MKSKYNSLTIATPTLFVSLFVLSLFFFSTAPVSAQANQAKDLVAKCVAAMGGPKAIEAFANYEAEGAVKVTFGTRELAGSIKLVQQGRKRYQKVKISFGSREFIVMEAHDGKVTWRDMMGTLADQPTLNDESDLDHTMALLTKKGVTYTMGKSTEIEGKKAMAVIAEYKGKKTSFFIDQTNFMVLEIVFKDLYFGDKQVKESMEKRIRYLNFKKTDGLSFPFTAVYYLKGKKNVELLYDKVTFSPKIQASLFQRPDKAPDLRFRAERYE